jgi:hypothetical protein
MVQVVNADNYAEFIKQGIWSDALRAPPVVTPPQEDGPSPYRLCSLDTHSDECGEGHNGCRRTDTILEWEAENPGQYVSPMMYWGGRDLFFEHGDYIYYHKRYLQGIIDDDYELMQSQEDQEFINEFCAASMLAFESPDTNGYADFLFNRYNIMDVIQANPVGMPRFVKETAGFYVFESVGRKMVNSQTINPLMLRNIYRMTEDTSYFFSTVDPMDSLYIKDSQFYFADLRAWVSSSINYSVRKAMTLGLSIPTDKTIDFYPFARSYLENPNILLLINMYKERLEMDGYEFNIKTR